MTKVMVIIINRCCFAIGIFLRKLIRCLRATSNIEEITILREVCISLKHENEYSPFLFEI